MLRMLLVVAIAGCHSYAYTKETTRFELRDRAARAGYAPTSADDSTDRYVQVVNAYSADGGTRSERRELTVHEAHGMIEVATDDEEAFPSLTKDLGAADRYYSWFSPRDASKLRWYF